MSVPGSSTSTSSSTSSSSSSRSGLPRSRRSRRRSAIALAGAGGLLATSLVAATGTPSYAGAEPSPLVLKVPKVITGVSWDGDAYIEGGVSLKAMGSSFELWSHRPSYARGIVSELHRGSEVTSLPAGTVTSFDGMRKFLDVTVRTRKGKRVLHRTASVCLNGDSLRVVPDGAAHSPYPYGCPWNPYTLGSVQGVAQGWATTVPIFGFDNVPLKPGTYDLTVKVAQKYRTAFGMAASDARGTGRLRIVKEDDDGGELFASRSSSRAHPDSSALDEPRGTKPRGRRLADAPDTGPRPNLESLPAWGIGVSGRGNYLSFSATVWNGGTSPLVVDGFRRDGEDLMDAYQYFYDADGNQTGYVPAGEMEWDARKTHQHWHFEDFARYRLLDADKHGVQRSKKEAFCLANTDAVDYTIPDANWRPDSTDLATACGDYSSLAVREVLDTGSGDTYEQYRAGQSFNLKKIPNGVYYISVEANPLGRLTETRTDDNVALRKIRLGGRLGHRTVKVSKVGRISD